ncbi:MAG: ATP synthase A1 subunit C [Euryarchaeota archaeon]|nr:ATP synthase A1 subunit C [Euryarchaeota archaeon]
MGLRLFRKTTTGTSNYAYATARVRAKKAKLLPRETYLKMLKISLAEVTQVIRDTDYQEQVDALSSKFEGIDLIEGALNVNEEQTYSQVRGFVEGEAKELVGAFLDRHDFQDIKVVLRGKHYGASQEEIMKELLIEDREEFDFLRRLLADDVKGVDGVIEMLGEMGGKARVYHSALKRAEERRAEATLSDYEDELDRTYYQNLLEVVRADTGAKKPFRRFIEKEIDIVDLLAVLRYRRAQLPWDEVEPVLVRGGRDLDIGDLRRIYEAPSLDDVATELHATSIGDDLDAALATGSLSRVDIAARTHLMDSASGFSHMNPLSVLPIIDYLLRKRTEVRNLRAIARGKQAGLDEETIQDMLII